MGALKSFYQSVIDTYDTEYKAQPIVDIHEALDDAIEILLQRGYHADDIGVVALVIASKIALSEQEKPTRKKGKKLRSKL